MFALHWMSPLTPANAYTSLLSFPMYRVPSTPMAAEPENAFEAEVDQDMLPVVPFTAYMLPSVEPTYTVPSVPSAGEPITGPFVSNVHNSVPS